MSCRFVLPFSGSVGSDGAKPASDGIGRQTGKLPADWARPSRPTAKCRLKYGGGKLPNLRTPYPELVCTLLWTSGLVF